MLTDQQAGVVAPGSVGVSFLRPQRCPCSSNRHPRAGCPLQALLCVWCCGKEVLTATTALSLTHRDSIWQRAKLPFGCLRLKG